LVQETTLEAAKKAEIQEIFDTLLEHLPEHQRDRPYQLYFRSTPAIGPNAFALPGGSVVITDQLVKLFDDENVIAGVLGHEIGHVTGDHGLRQLYRSLGVFVLVGLLAGDTGPILEDVLLEGGVLLSLSYSRAHERDADQSGLRLADAAGYDPAGLMKFFRFLPDSRQTESGWSSTHPASGERIKAIQEYLENR
jgi:predicted Zn-dependent protease